MILNAAAVQRGLAHGSLYKTDALDLSEDRGKQLVRTAARKIPQAIFQALRGAIRLFALCLGANCAAAADSSHVSAQRTAKHRPLLPAGSVHVTCLLLNALVPFRTHVALEEPRSQVHAA